MYSGTTPMSRRRKSYGMWDALITHFRAAPGRPLRHRRGFAVVLRSVERAQHRLLGRHSAAAILLRALRAHRPRPQKRQPATPRGRPRNRSRLVGSRVPQLTSAHNHVPVDFVSTHGYADDTVENLFHNDQAGADGRARVPRAAPRSGQIELSRSPSSALLDGVERAGTRSVTRHDICRPGAGQHHPPVRWARSNEMSFWTFSDVFEEGGRIEKPFEGNFGLRAKGGIDKPSFYGFELLHELGSSASPSLRKTSS